jgi:hypothetical protein
MFPESRIQSDLCSDGCRSTLCLGFKLRQLEVPTSSETPTSTHMTDERPHLSRGFYEGRPIVSAHFRFSKRIKSTNGCQIRALPLTFDHSRESTKLMHYDVLIAT